MISSISPLFEVSASNGALPAISHSTRKDSALYLTGPCSHCLADVVCEFFVLPRFLSILVRFEVLTAIMLQKRLVGCQDLSTGKHLPIF